MTIQSTVIGPGTLKLNTSRTITGVTTTSASKTITSPTAAFLSGDVGVPISGVGIAAGSTIAAVLSPTQATLSANATASGTVAVTITPAAMTDVSCQVKSGKVVPSEQVTAGDTEDMLCGEQLVNDDVVTVTYQLQATLKQDLTLTGFTTWTYANAGKEVWCQYVPSTALGVTAAFPVRVAPLDFGGDVKTRPDHDLAWAIPKIKPTFS